MRNQQLLQTLSNCINHCNHCADACLDEDDGEMYSNRQSLCQRVQSHG